MTNLQMARPTELRGKETRPRSLPESERPLRLYGSTDTISTSRATRTTYTTDLQIQDDCRVIAVYQIGNR